MKTKTAKQSEAGERSEHTPGPREILESAIDWMCDAEKHTDQWERGQELKKLRPVITSAPELLKVLKKVEDSLYVAGYIDLRNEVLVAIAKAEWRE